MTMWALVEDSGCYSDRSVAVRGIYSSPELARDAALEEVNTWTTPPETMEWQQSEYPGEPVGTWVMHAKQRFGYSTEFFARPFEVDSPLLDYPDWQDYHAD